jgi:hypothetical protein
MAFFISSVAVRQSKPTMTQHHQRSAMLVMERQNWLGWEEAGDERPSTCAPKGLAERTKGSVVKNIIIDKIFRNSSRNQVEQKCSKSELKQREGKKV